MSEGGEEKKCVPLPSEKKLEGSGEKKRVSLPSKDKLEGRERENTSIIIKTGTRLLRKLVRSYTRQMPT